ncbi:unnamed protein product, partial [Iphiclides podalirius]
MDPKVQLAREYCKLLDSKILWLLKFTGYLRFATNNGHIVKRNATTAFVRCLNSIISGNSSAFYMFYVLSWKENYLIQSEVILLMLIAVLQNSILLNIAGPNRNTGLVLLNYCMEIDCHLGIKPTKFMRDIVVRTFLTLSIFIFSFQAIIVTVLVFAYKTPLSIHVVGTIYFTLLFMIYYDICFLLTFYAFLALRVHYLNVAIIKRAGVNADEILKLTRSILNTLEIREPRLSLYGMCFLNTGLVLRFAASIFVYITVQLQILIPAFEETKQEPATLSRNGVFLFGWGF